MAALNNKTRHRLLLRLFNEVRKGKENYSYIQLPLAKMTLVEVLANRTMAKKWAAACTIEKKVVPLREIAKLTIENVRHIPFFSDFNFFFTTVLAVALSGLYALPIRATALVQPVSFSGFEALTLAGEGGVRAVYLFDRLSDAQLQTEKAAYWYDSSNKQTPVGGTAYTISPALEDGKTYIIVQGQDTDVVAVFDYQRYRIGGKSMQLRLTCSSNDLTFTDIPQMSYYDAEGYSHTLKREFSLHYRTLQANYANYTWEEIEVEDTLSLTRMTHIDIPRMLYLPTDIELRGDRYAEQLYGDADLQRIPRDQVQPIAIGFMPQSFTAIRGSDPENERDRVTEEEGEKGLSGSAPLNVLFRANATPTAAFYSWTIKRSNDVIASRTDNQTRYVFDESGNYTVALHIENAVLPPDTCSCDTLFKVTANESWLAIPNVFTPNGDGANDEFRVAYRSLKSFRCLIFNRWQHQIYTFTDPAQGWDGRINGRKAPEGAYYYIIEATGTDGVKYKRKGAVNLLRGKK